MMYIYMCSIYLTFVRSLKRSELTAADHAHFSGASSGDGHTLSYSGVICKYDYSDWQTIFTSLAMTVCVCVCVCVCVFVCVCHMHTCNFIVFRV